MNRGRKRKANVIRSASGKSLGETPEEARSVVMAQRIREVGERHAADPLAGSSLGKLLLWGMITTEQRDAGEQWAHIEHQHRAVMGYEVKPVRAASLEARSPTTGDGAEPTPEQIDFIKRRWQAGHEAITDVCRYFGPGVREIVHAVCVDNRPAEWIRGQDLANLRVGLNALGRVLRGSRTSY